MSFPNQGDEAAGPTVVVDVEDNGASVSPEARERVFDRFFTTKPDGMGMGLSISRSIIGNRGGGYG